MDSFTYWQERAKRAAAGAYNSQELKTAAYLAAYRDAYDDMAKETAALVAKMGRNGQLSLSELYKFGRYQTYMKQVDDITGKLAKGEVAFADKSFSKLYETVFRSTGNITGIQFDRIPLKTMERILQHPWSGENYSERIWANRDALVRNTRQTVIRGVVKGQSISTMTKELQGHVEGSAFNARRLIRTESMHFVNQGQLDGYKRLGIDEVTIIVAEDERTCPVCMANDGRVVSMQEAELLLPAHPLCRCTYAPTQAAIDRAMASLSMDVPAGAAMDAEPKTAESKPDALAERRKKLKADHDYIKKTHRKDFDRLIDNMDENQLILYEKMTEFIKQNSYYKGSGYYSPLQKKVFMNLGSKPWETAAGTKQSAAWGTKFHEEFHQLDHLLAKTPLAHDAYGGIPPYINASTDVRTLVGGKLSKAIDDDILEVVNKAIVEYGSDTGTVLSQITKLDDATDDVSRALSSYLQKHYPNAKDRAEIAMFTDAVGMQTSGKVLPYKWGFWGHDKSYSASKGISGATSETWATYGQHKMANYGKLGLDSSKAAKELMPRTFKQCDEIIEEVYGHIEANGLKYR